MESRGGGRRREMRGEECGGRYRGDERMGEIREKEMIGGKERRHTSDD